uniref:Transposase n=1 Tax=Leptobrachium leishanense TaxID=445787 RepID=A0A8C5PF25_9ANUR
MPLTKELSLSVKQAIIRLKKQNKPIREIVRTLGVAKTIVWNILKKKERTGELSNTKKPGRPRKTTVVDDRRILSLVKKTPFSTVGQIESTLQEVGVCVSKSTIKRRHHQSEYRGFTTRCKPLVSLKNRKARLEFAKQHLTNIPPHHSRMNSEVFRAILSAYIQPNAAELIGRRFTVQMDNDPKHTAKATKEFLKGQKWNVIQWPSQSPDLNPIEHVFHLLKTKLKGKCLKNQQELKTVAVEAWQSITRDETQRLVMSMRSRLQAVIDCKGFATKY